MKIRHNVPVAPFMRSAVLTPEYQAEVDRAVARGEAAYRRAQKRLAAAERRLARAQRAPVGGQRQHKRQIAELEALVALRIAELEHVHRLMTSTGAPSTARGRKSHRHVPDLGLPL